VRGKLNGTSRGGVLTQASVLTLTSRTAPVVRGAWILDRILGTSPPPPPDVPGLEESKKVEATSLRERLEHRQDGPPHALQGRHPAQQPVAVDARVG